LEPYYEYRKPGTTGKVPVVIKHEDLMGLEHRSRKEMEVPEEGFQDEGIRKAILLVHYCEAVRMFMEKREGMDERERERLGRFGEHFRVEKELLKDPSLAEEMAVLDAIVRKLFPQGKGGERVKEEEGGSRMVEEAEGLKGEKPENQLETNKLEKPQGEGEENWKGTVEAASEEEAKGKEKEKEKEKEKKEKEKEREEREGDKCTICLDEGKEVVFLPCRHVPCCAKCSPSLLECPLCRSPVKDRFVVFV